MLCSVCWEADQCLYLYLYLYFNLYLYLYAVCQSVMHSRVGVSGAVTGVGTPAIKLKFLFRAKGSNLHRDTFLSLSLATQRPTLKNKNNLVKWEVEEV